MHLNSNGLVTWSVTSAAPLPANPFSVSTYDRNASLRLENLGWPVEPSFLVPKEAEQHFRKAIDHGREAETEWNAKFAAYEKQFPELARELRQLINGELPQDWDATSKHSSHGLQVHVRETGFVQIAE